MNHAMLYMNLNFNRIGGPQSWTPSIATNSRVLSSKPLQSSAMEGYEPVMEFEKAHQLVDLVSVPLVGSTHVGHGRSHEGQRRVL